jgi:Protein of unknown function (DUF3303)
MNGPSFSPPPLGRGVGGEGAPGDSVLYMVIERFKDRDAVAVYRRLREKGRMAPEGLRYVSSWVETNFDRCFQLMECDNPRLFEQWFANWIDFVEFEMVPVMSSPEAARAVAARL